MAEIANPIRVGLHGHILPDYGPWWKKKLGFDPNENIAKIMFDACRFANIGIYTITDDEFGRMDGLSRFFQMRNAARDLGNNNGYGYERLGENAFVLEKEDYQLVGLDGESLDITDNERKYEMLTFGKSGLPSFRSLDQAFDYLDSEGLPAIAEHPLAHGHQGPMSEELFKYLCREKKFTCVEYNAKLAVPNWMSILPLDMIRGHVKNKNLLAERIATTYGIPIIYNDDADTPTQIATAYTIFDKDKVDTANGDAIKNSMIAQINSREFEFHTGDISKQGSLGTIGLGFFGYALNIAHSIFSEKLRLKQKYDTRHS